MRKSRVIFLILLLTLALSACTLSANEPVEFTPEVQEDPYKDIFDQSATQPEVEGTEEMETEEPADPTEADTEEPLETEDPIEEPTEEPVAETEAPTDDPTEDPTEELVVTDDPVETPSSDMVVPESYAIHKGESPFCLARRFDVDAVTLLNFNGLSMDYVASVGVILNIPADAAPFNGLRALLPHPDTYTVKQGETLYSISCLYGDVWPEEIAAANGLTMADAMSLSVGQELQIP